MRQAQAVGETRHGHCQRAVQVAVADDGRPAEQVAGSTAGQRVVGRRKPPRRHHAGIHRVGLAVGQFHQHAAAAAQAAHPGLEHAQRQRGRYGGIDRVPAGAQKLGPDLGGPPMLGGDDASTATHRNLGRLPRIDHGMLSLRRPAAIPCTRWRRHQVGIGRRRLNVA